MLAAAFELLELFLKSVSHQQKGQNIRQHTVASSAHPYALWRCPGTNGQILMNLSKLWETVGTEEPGRLQSMGWQGVRHD